MEESQSESDPQQRLTEEQVERVIGEVFEMSPGGVSFMTYKGDEKWSASWTIPVSGASRLVRSTEDAEQLIEGMQSMGSFCPSCITVSRDMYLLHRSVDEEAESVCTLVWTVVLETLLEAITHGCQLCTFMARNFFAKHEIFIQAHREVENVLGCCGYATSEQISAAATESIERLRDFTQSHPETTIGLVVEPIDYVLHEGGRRFAKVRFTPVETSLELDQLNQLLSLHSVEDFSITVEVFALSENDPFFKYVRAGPINTRPDDVESISWAKHMLHRCSNEHLECPDDTTVPLPTRVVEIRADNTLRLATEQPDALYSTLSYCWGGPQPFQTTKDTLTAKSERFDISELPKILQDAVSLTRKRGLRYIWIDFLCIVQDDEIDKAKELANMARYYSTAHVIICVGGDSCNAGFLAPHSGCEDHLESDLPRDLLRLPVLYPVDEKSAEMTTLLFRPENTRVRRADAIEGRAWTLQERILSPRVLFYGFDRSLWQCSTEICGNGGNEDWKRLKKDRLFDNFDYQRIRAALIQGKSAIEGREVIDLSQLHKMWHYSVEEFTCRALTHQGDKLPAIAALASRFSEVFQDISYAGLWEKYLIAELLWSTWPHLGNVPSHSGAPSWSWASVSNRVTYSTIPTEPFYTADMVELQHQPTTITESIELRIHAPLFTFGESGDRIIEHWMKQEYVLPTVGMSQLLCDINNEKLAHMGLLMQSMPSNRKWTVPPGSALLFLALNFKDGVDLTDTLGGRRFRADQMNIHGLIVAPAEDETIMQEQENDEPDQQKKKKWRHIGQFSSLDGAEFPPLVQYIMDESRKQWVCII